MAGSLFLALLNSRSGIEKIFDINKWKKHRQDILKLSLLLTGDERIQMTGKMIEHFESFITHLEQEVDQKMIKTIVNGMVTIDKGLTLDALKKVFIY